MSLRGAPRSSPRVLLFIIFFSKGPGPYRPLRAPDASPVFRFSACAEAASCRMGGTDGLGGGFARLHMRAAATMPRMHPGPHDRAVRSAALSSHGIYGVSPRAAPRSGPCPGRLEQPASVMHIPREPRATILRLGLRCRAPPSRSAAPALSRSAHRADEGSRMVAAPTPGLGPRALSAQPPSDSRHLRR